MHKHDYIAIAKAIKENTQVPQHGYSIINAEWFIEALCNILKADNKNFDKAKFMEAVK